VFLTGATGPWRPACLGLAGYVRIDQSLGRLGKCSLAFALIYTLYVSRIVQYRIPQERPLAGNSGHVNFKGAGPLTPCMGWGSQTIGQITKGTFEVKPGSLFPALERMEEVGWLISTLGRV